MYKSVSYPRFLTTVWLLVKNCVWWTWPFLVRCKSVLHLWKVGKLPVWTSLALLDCFVFQKLLESYYFKDSGLLHVFFSHDNQNALGFPDDYCHIGIIKMLILSLMWKGSPWANKPWKGNGPRWGYFLSHDNFVCVEMLVYHLWRE